MARPIWSGSISFGLVTVPVELYSATEDHTVHFRQLERDTADRIRYRRVNERTGEEIAQSDIVKGYDTGDGEYVVVEPEELDDIAPGRSRSIDIESFVELDDIDPIYFQRTYWLAPSDKDFYRSYGLLIQAMTRTNKAGIATFVMRGKEYLAAVRAGEGLLLLDTLHFAADLRDPAKQIGDLPESAPSRGRELDMAVQLVESMAEDWEPEKYTDEYTERVHRLIREKKAGHTVTAAEEPDQPTKVVDLFDALSRSVRGGSRRPGKDSGSGTKSTAAGSSEDLGELSKAELERIARELAIKGRSGMRRAELAEAIAAARSAGSGRLARGSSRAS